MFALDNYRRYNEGYAQRLYSCGWVGDMRLLICHEDKWLSENVLIQNGVDKPLMGTCNPVGNDGLLMESGTKKGSLRRHVRLSNMSIELMQWQLPLHHVSQSLECLRPIATAMILRTNSDSHLGTGMFRIVVEKVNQTHGFAIYINDHAQLTILEEIIAAGSDIEREGIAAIGHRVAAVLP